MGKDFLYEKAPLVEVIAEIHWVLKELQVAPNAKIDPHYEEFEKEFLEFLREDNLCHTQELPPSSVSIELVPHLPRKIIRSQPNDWPLVQLGPGIITAHVVPPYSGWTKFEKFLIRVVDGLYKCYPNSGKSLFIETLLLRFISGFDDEFGFEKYSDFALDMLGIRSPLPTDFLKECAVEQTDISYVLETLFENVSPVGSFGRVFISPGTSRDKRALIMEMQCESIYPQRTVVSQCEVKQWFNEAHRSLHDQFDKIATDKLKEMLVKKQEPSK